MTASWDRRRHFMNLSYTCRGFESMNPSTWKGNIDILETEKLIEANVTARNSSFHIIIGRHRYGSFICIPNGEWEQNYRSFPIVFGISADYRMYTLNFLLLMQSASQMHWLNYLYIIVFNPRGWNNPPSFNLPQIKEG